MTQLLRNERVLLPALHVATLWPLWPWLYARWSDGSGEGWGALAWLLAVHALSAQSHANRREPTSPIARPPARPFANSRDAYLPLAQRSPWLSCALLLAYTAAYPFCPPLVRSGIAMLSLAATAAPLWLGRPFSWPLAGLLVLGLPLEATLQFYFGYPLRFLVAEASAPLLATLGLDASAQGTQLAAGGLMVEVDGPCSGLKMLRTGLVLSCFVALRWRLGALGWAAHLALTVAALVFANVLRATSLFVLALLSAEPPDFFHAGTGLIAFAAVLGLQLLAIHRLAPRRVAVAGARS